VRLSFYSCHSPSPTYHSVYHQIYMWTLFLGEGEENKTAPEASGSREARAGAAAGDGRGEAGEGYAYDTRGYVYGVVAAYNR
jgi:hypothetical protein